VSDDGQHVVIRPLVYVTEAEARAYTRERKLPVIGCCCPACGDLGLQRQRVKRLLVELEREHPSIRASMIRALGNVMPRHLLDRRLNPPGFRRPVDDEASLQTSADLPLVPLLRPPPQPVPSTAAE
jgi:tRNA 2-thiocytidine biosynthesis protein TtcA